MAIIARWNDYNGRVVELTDEGWTHVRAGHPDMTDGLDSIGAAITSAALVIRDPAIRRLEHFYGVARGGLRIHVVVIYRPTPEGWIGTIQTAHHTDRTKQGNSDGRDNAEHRYRRFD